MKGQPGKFVRFEDFTYDGEVNINSIESKNVVTVRKTHTGTLQSIEGILTPTLATTKVTNATITVSGRSATLAGEQYDTAVPTFRKKKYTEYLRTKVTR